MLSVARWLSYLSLFASYAQVTAYDEVLIAPGTATHIYHLLPPVHPSYDGCLYRYDVICDDKANRETGCVRREDTAQAVLCGTTSSCVGWVFVVAVCFFDLCWFCFCFCCCLLLSKMTMMVLMTINLVSCDL